MNNFKSIIKVSENDYPVILTTQALVAGGGPAGIAAAETLARLGKKTILVEQYGFLGGAAVAGLSGTICGMYYASEKNEAPKMLVGGFAKKFANELEKRNGLTPPQKYGKTYVRTHDALTFKEVAEDMIKSAGATILYHTKICGVVMEDETFRGLLVDTKSGFGIIKADIIIDSTGDADVIYRAGLDTYFGDNGKIQNPTMIFKASNVNMNKFLTYMNGNTIAPDDLVQKILKENKNGSYKLPREHIWLFDTVNNNEVLCNVTRIVGEDGRDLNVTNPFDHTEAEYYGRKQVKEYIRFFKQNLPGFENAYIIDTSTEVGVRQTRSIKGIKQLKNEDVVSCTKSPDGVVKSAWPIELHSGYRPKLQWILDDYYTIPYGALVPIVGENIIVAGRNLYAEHEALASCRVLGQCFEYGHAAATAAAISIDKGLKIRDINGIDVVNAMNYDGAEL